MTAHLSLVGVGITFPSGRAVGPVSAELGPGLHHLTGRNGSGKTTLLRCICGAWRGSTGTVTVRGQGAASDPRRDPRARRDVALVTAEPELPPFLTVDEAWTELAAIRGAPRWDGARLRDTFGLPGGLPLAHCSAGQRRLAELLAAAAGDPRILLLDEPFANLDPVSTERLAAQLDAWRRERVIVVTSHGPVPIPVDSVVALQDPRTTD